METKDVVSIDGIGKEDHAEFSVLSRMARMMSKQISQKGAIGKLEVIKDKSKVKLRLIFNEGLTESEGEDNNVFFAFGKAQQDLFKKLGF